MCQGKLAGMPDLVLTPSTPQPAAQATLDLQGTRVLSITAMMMSALVAGVCAYIVSMLPCTGPSFTPYICSLFHVMCAPPGWCSIVWWASLKLF